MFLKIDFLCKGKIVFYSETKVIFLFLFLTLISVADIRFYKIPDSLLLSLFILLFSIDVKNDYNNILIHIASAILMFLIFFLIYEYVGGLGFGDVKFISVLSYSMGFRTSVCAFLSAALIALLFLGSKTIIFGKAKARIPFAPFLSLGSLVAISMCGGL